MKKSYDYFETLKTLSELVSVIYEKTLLEYDFSSERIIFFAEKSELINNLQNEFITPLERGDIFLLEENITDIKPSQGACVEVMLGSDGEKTEITKEVEKLYKNQDKSDKKTRLELATAGSTNQGSTN